MNVKNKIKNRNGNARNITGANGPTLTDKITNMAKSAQEKMTNLGEKAKEMAQNVKQKVANKVTNATEKVKGAPISEKLTGIAQTTQQFMEANSSISNL